jgi:hypothetical protein
VYDGVEYRSSEIFIGLAGREVSVDDVLPFDLRTLRAAA